MTTENPSFNGYDADLAMALSQEWTSVSHNIGKACLGGGQSHNVPGGPWTRVGHFSNKTQVTRDIRPMQPAEAHPDGRLYVDIFNGQRGEISTSFGAIEVDARNLATLQIFTPPPSV